MKWLIFPVLRNLQKNKPTKYFNRRKVTTTNFSPLTYAVSDAKINFFLLKVSLILWTGKNFQKKWLLDVLRLPWTNTCLLNLYVSSRIAVQNVSSKMFVISSVTANCWAIYQNILHLTYKLSFRIATFFYCKTSKTLWIKKTNLMRKRLSVCFIIDIFSQNVVKVRERNSNHWTETLRW